MHWIGRFFVGLIIMGVGVALMMYAPQITDMFDQPPAYMGYIRMAGMAIILLAVLFMFGVIDTSSADIGNASINTGT